MSGMDVDAAEAPPAAPAAGHPAAIVPGPGISWNTPPAKSAAPRDITARRRTAKLACDFCHKKKTRCDGAYPCSSCKKRHIDCLWAGGAPVNLIAGSYTPEYVKWLEEQVSSLSGSTKLIDDRKYGVPSAGHRLSPGPAAAASSPSQPVRETTASQFAPVTEVAGTNQHTKDQEFYGSSSSMALLARVGRSPSTSSAGRTASRQEEPDALVTSLHNPVFSQRRALGNESSRAASEPGASGPQYRVFLDGFFSTLHFIFPILDKKGFMRRCERLWRSEGEAENSSFLALYFSVLSLGALVGPRSEEPINGRDNLSWSRKFFEDARLLCSNLGMVTDLEMVQCYFFLSKVCQNELHPHLTYMYVGLAVRTALAIGINRQRPPATSEKDPEVVKAETRTWWGLYSLETELSFGMGRPDTLGADLYHNRPFPITIYSTHPVTDTEHGYDLLEPAHCAILEFMVDFSRIIRRIRLELYVPESPATSDQSLALQHAASIEQELDGWLRRLPDVIRPQRDSGQQTSLKSAKEPQYVKKQKLVLGIRYHNLRILLFGSFLLGAGTRGDALPGTQECIQKCLHSAKETIDIIYETYRHHDFFRTWFYNITYTVFASSMILLSMSQAGPQASDQQSLVRYVEMAIEILEVMDESVIAVKSAGMIKRALDRVRGSHPSSAAPPVAPANPPDVENDPLWLPAHHYWGSLNLLDGGLDENFPFHMDSWA